MTRRVNETLFIEAERKQTCELCGAEDETRPYGPKGEQVCFECAMKDEPAAKRAFLQRLDPQ